MACDLFSKNVSRDSQGRVSQVRFRNKPSKLYDQLLDKVREGSIVMTDYLRSYADNLVKRDFLKPNPSDPENMNILSAKEKALMLYSRIFTPTFKDDFGDWESAKSAGEPTLEEVEKLLYEPYSTPDSEVQNQRFSSYDTDILADIASDIKKLIEEGIDSDDLFEELSSQGYNINKKVLDRMFQVENSVKPAQGLLETDIKSEKYTYAELLAIYTHKGLSEAYIQKRINHARIAKKSQSVNSSGTLDKGATLEGKSSREKKQIIKKSIQAKQKSYLSDIQFEMASRDGTETGTKISSIKDLRRYGRRIIRDIDVLFDRDSFRNVLAVLEILWGQIKVNGMSVTLHDSAASYANVLEENGQDPFENMDTSGFISGSEVHLFIGTPLISGQVAAHEIIHPIVEQMFDKNLSLFESFREVLLDTLEINPDIELNPNEKLEMTIDYLAKLITEQAQSSNKGKLKQPGYRSILESMSDSDLLNNILKQLGRFFSRDVKNPEHTLDEFINSQENGAKLLEKLAKSFSQLKGVKVDQRFIDNDNVRFSMSSDTRKEAILRDIIVGRPDDFYDDGYKLDSPKVKRHAQMLVDVARDMGINPDIIGKIYKDLRESKDDFETSANSSLLSRITEGNLANFDARTIRGIRDYLIGRRRERMPDAVMEKFFRHFSRSVGGYREMAKMILESVSSGSLGDNPSVKFYLLDRILTKGIREITPQQKRDIVDQIEKIRSEAGRTMRLMRSDRSLSLGPLSVMEKARQHMDHVADRLGFNEVVDSLIKALPLNDETASKIVASLSSDKLIKMFNNYSLDEFEISTTLVQEGLEKLLEMKVGASSFVKNQHLTREQRKANSDKADPAVFTEQDWAEIAYVYVHNYSKGNIPLARAKFNQDFPNYKGKFINYKNSEAFNPDRASHELAQHARNSLVQWINNYRALKEGEIRLDRDGNTQVVGKTSVVPKNTSYNSNPFGRILRQAVIDLELHTNFIPSLKDAEQAIPLNESLEKLAYALKEENINEEEILEAAINRLQSLIREEALAPDNKKNKKKLERLKSDKAFAEDLMKRMTQAYGEGSSKVFKDYSLDALRKGVRNRVNEFLDDYKDSNGGKNISSNSLISKIIQDLNTPPEITSLIEEELQKQLEKVVLEEVNIEETIGNSNLKIDKAGLSKMINLMKEGVFDRDVAFQIFKDQNKYKDFGELGGVPHHIEYKLVSLQNELNRANTTYGRNLVMQKMGRLMMDLANTTADRFIMSYLQGWIYANMLSSPTTGIKSILSGISTGTSHAMGVVVSEVASSLLSYVFKGDKEHFRYFLKTLKQTFGDFYSDSKGLGSKIHQTMIEDLQTSEMARRTGLYQQAGGSTPYSMFFQNIVAKRWEALKKAKKGDFKGAMKIFVDDLVSGDMGSHSGQTMVHKFSNTVSFIPGFKEDGNGNMVLTKAMSTGIRLTSALLPLAIGTTVFGLGAAPLFVSAPFAVGSVIMSTYLASKFLPLTDYGLSHVFRNFAGNMAAYSATKHKYKDAQHDQQKKVWEEQKTRMGLAPHQLGRISQLIEENFPDHLDYLETKKGRELSPREIKKEFDKYKLNSLLNFKEEYRNPLDMNQGVEVANSIAVIGMPTGLIGEFTSWWKNFVNTPSAASDAHYEQVLGQTGYKGSMEAKLNSIGLIIDSLIRVTLNLVTVPFIDVMANIMQRAYEHSLIGGIVNYGQMLFKDRDHFRVESSYKERPHEEPLYTKKSMFGGGERGIYHVEESRARARMLRPLWGTLVHVGLLAYLFEFVEPGDEEDDEGLLFGRLKIDTDRKIWDYIRITGPGTGNFATDNAVGDGYQALSIQYNIGGKWKTLGRYIDYPVISGLAPIGARFDKELFNKGKTKMAIKNEELDLKFLFEELINSAVRMSAYGLGQNFNPGINVIFDAISELVGGNLEDKTYTSVLEEAGKELLARPIASFATPGHRKNAYQFYKYLVDIPLKKGETFQPTSWLDNVVKHNAALEPLIRTKNITDALGYDIDPELPINPEIKAVASLFIPQIDQRHDRLLEESPFYAFTNEHEGVMYPFNTGMWDQINLEGTDFGGTLPTYFTRIVSEHSKPRRRELLEDRATIDIFERMMKGELDIAEMLTRKDLFSTSNAYIPNLLEDLDDDGPSQTLKVNQIINKISKKAVDEAKTKLFYEIFRDEEVRSIIYNKKILLEDPDVNEFTWRHMTKFLRQENIKFAPDTENNLRIRNPRINKTVTIEKEGFMHYAEFGFIPAEYIKNID